MIWTRITVSDFIRAYLYHRRQLTCS